MHVDDITPQIQMLSHFNLLRGLSASNSVAMCGLFRLSDDNGPS